MNFYFLLIPGCGFDQSVSTISVSPLTITIGINKVQRFYATAYDANNQVVTKDFIWAVTGSIGSVDATGLFYAGGAVGSGTVVASCDGQSGVSSVTITDKGTVTGRLTNTPGERIANMTVYVSQNSSLSSVSNANGEYTISNVPYGTQEVSVRENLLYISSSYELFVATGETKTQNFLLVDRLSIENEIVSGDPISVSGQARNNGSTEAQNATVTYSFFDEEGNLSSSASQNLGSIPAGSTHTYYLSPSPIISSYTTMKSTAAPTSY